MFTPTQLARVRKALKEEARTVTRDTTLALARKACERERQEERRQARDQKSFACALAWA